MWRTSFCRTLFSGKSIFNVSDKSTRLILCLRARRNARGHLEPDAPEDKIQESLGFGSYEHAVKSNTNKVQESSTSTVDKSAT